MIGRGNECLEERTMVQNLEQRDQRIAAATSCPAFDCGSLVIEYRQPDNVQLGHPQDWEFKCFRCGTEFTVAQSGLIFQSIPIRWLSPNAQLASSCE